MKSSELHRLIKQAGWMPIRQCGSHIIYEKNGIRYCAPDHGSKEMGKGIALKILKEMGI